MSAPQPPSIPAPSDDNFRQWQSLSKNLSWGMLFLCPTIALMPPRKLDLYTFGLGGMWIWSANNLSKTYYHQSIIQRYYSRKGPSSTQNHSSIISLPGSDLPTEKAREMHTRLLAEKAAAGKDLEAEKERKRGVWEKVWLGGEKAGWKERRLREEREALEEGKSYGGIIMDTIWEVWNGGKKEREHGDNEKDGKS